jgi:3-phosphoshikimate 1-carboxyvinyltransferase
MRRVTEPLVAMGAKVVQEGPSGLPLSITGGRLRSFTYEMPVASAQVKTALMFAGLVGGVDVTVGEPARSRDHTERLLRYLGADVRVEGLRVTLGGATVRLADLPPFRLEVPGDISSAAFLIGAALLAEGGELRLEGVGVNPTRTGVLSVLARMGASIDRYAVREVGGEPVADLLVRPAQLGGTVVQADEIPSLIDEVPILAVLASRAQGETRFCSVGELRLKESDRLDLIARNLRSVGARASVEGDDLVVLGHGEPPKGVVDTARDHRLAMAFAVLGTVRGADVSLSETRSVAVSYPQFFHDLNRIGSNG